jgi:hypothetical protein
MALVVSSKIQVRADSKSLHIFLIDFPETDLAFLGWSNSGKKC